jgi:hypothetical protein
VGFLAFFVKLALQTNKKMEFEEPAVSALKVVVFLTTLLSGTTQCMFSLRCCRRSLILWSLSIKNIDPVPGWCGHSNAASSHRGWP